MSQPSQGDWAQRTVQEHQELGLLVMQNTKRNEMSKDCAQQLAMFSRNIFSRRSQLTETHFLVAHNWQTRMAERGILIGSWEYPWRSLWSLVADESGSVLSKTFSVLGWRDWRIGWSGLVRVVVLAKSQREGRERFERGAEHGMNEMGWDEVIRGVKR